MCIIETARLGAEEGMPLSRNALSMFLSDNLDVVPSMALAEGRNLVQAVEENDFRRGLDLCSCIQQKMNTHSKISLQLRNWLSFVGVAKAHFERLQREAGIGLN